MTVDRFERRRLSWPSLVATAAVVLGMLIVAPSFASPRAAGAAPAGQGSSHRGAPVVTRLSASSGPLRASRRLVVHGRHFTHVRWVSFGATKVRRVRVISSHKLKVRVPRARHAHAVAVRVRTSKGTSARRAAARYRFVSAPVVTGLRPSSGSTRGGTLVVVNGRHLSGASVVWFGSRRGSKVHVASSHVVTVVAPALPAGTASVRVVTPGGRSKAARGASFTAARPETSGLSLSAVNGLSTSVTSTSVTLAWTNPTESSFAGVTVRRANGATPPATPIAGTLVADTTGTVHAATDSGLNAGQIYSYALWAHDTAGRTAPAAVVTVTLPSTDSPDDGGIVPQSSTVQLDPALIQDVVDNPDGTQDIVLGPSSTPVAPRILAGRRSAAGSAAPATTAPPLGGDPCTIYGITHAAGAPAPGAVLSAPGPHAPYGVMAVASTATSRPAGSQCVIHGRPATIDQAYSAFDVNNVIQTLAPRFTNDHAFSNSTKLPFGCSTTSGYDFSLNADFSDTKVRFSAHLKDASVSFALVSKPKFTASASVSGSGSCTANLDKFHLFIPIPGTVFTFELEPTASISFSGGISGTATWQPTIRVNSQGGDPSSTSDWDRPSGLDVGTPTFSLSGSASLTATAELDASLRAAHIVGITGSFGPELHFDKVSAPCGMLTLQGALKATVDLFFKKWDHTIATWTPVAQAIGDCPRITTTRLPMATYGQPYSTELTTADHRHGTWSIVAGSGSLPAGLTLDGYTISGTPTELASHQFTLRFTDDNGSVDEAVAGIDVAPATDGSSVWDISDLPRPDDATPAGSAYPWVVGCGADSCLASGWYQGDTGDRREVLWVRQNGRWSVADLPLPPDAESGHGDDWGIDQVACGAATNCAAVGHYYSGTAQASVGVAWALTADGWRASRLPLPSNTVASQAPTIGRLSCGGDDACAAVGTYQAPDGSAQVLWTKSNGSWGLASDAELIGPNGAGDVSCTELNTCMAVPAAAGSNSDDQTILPLWTWSHGTWTKTLITNPSPTPGLAEDSLRISCGSSENCVITGDRLDGRGTEMPFLWTLDEGSWLMSEAPSPPDYDPWGTVRTQVWTVSCGAVTSCVAFGPYSRERSTAIGFAMWTWDGASWKVNSPDDPDVLGLTMSCGADDFCMAGDSNSSGGLWDRRGGSWAPVAQPSLPGYSPGDYLGVIGISCSRPDLCAVLFDYYADDAAGGRERHALAMYAGNPQPD